MAGLVQALLSCATLAGAAILVLAVVEERRRSGRTLWAVPAAIGLGVMAGLPGLLAPILSAERLRLLAGAGSIIAAAWLALLAGRSRAFARRALAGARLRQLSEVAALAPAEGADIGVRACLHGDPPVEAPLSATPCLAVCLTVHRGPIGGEEELVCLERRQSPRLVLRDGAGGLPLAPGTALSLRDSPSEESTAEGELDVERLAAPAAGVDGGVLDGLIRDLDPAPPAAGRWRYRIVERAWKDGEACAASGTLRRVDGALVLEPFGHSVKLQGEVQAPARALRAKAWALGLGASAAFAIGLMWFA